MTIKGHTRQLFIVPLLWVAALLAAGCNDDLTTPSFIHIDSIVLQPNGNHVLFADEGMLTSEIDAVVLYAHRKGTTKIDTIGHFTLPFTAPLLMDGEIDYLEVAPAVKWGGSSRAIVPYPFYKEIFHRDLRLTAGDTLDLGTDTTYYDLSLDQLRIFINFEPPASDIFFDSVMQWTTGDHAGACRGGGYGYVPVAADQTTVNFAIDRTFTVANPLLAVWMELDSRSDIEYSVNMISRYTSGGAEDQQEVMRIRPSEDWVHMYINLGTTWSYFNHYQDFRISFTAINGDGQEGEIRLDNVRLVTHYPHFNN